LKVSAHGYRYAIIAALLLSFAIGSNTTDVITTHGSVSDAAVLTWQPRNMELVGQIGGPAYAVAVQGHYAYLGIGPRLVVLDVTDPTQPGVIGLSKEMPDYVADVAVSGTRAFVVWSSHMGASNSGLWILDVADPTQPRLIGRHPMPGRSVNRIRVVDNYIYVAMGDLRIFDVSNATVPQEVGAYRLAGGIEDVYVVGKYAYVAWSTGYNPAMPGSSGLRIVDVSDPTAPQEVGFFPTAEGANAVYVADNVAYLGDGEGVWIVDVSNPADPQPLGRYEVPAGVRGAIRVVGNYAYLTTWNRGLHILDVSDPSVPVQVGVQDVPGVGADMEVENGYAYVASTAYALSIIDVSDPERPVQAGAYDAPNRPNDVDVLGNYAYVTDDTPWVSIGRRLRIIDVSNPALPAELSSYRLPDGGIYHVLASGHYAYVVTSEGIFILDVSNPRAPHVVAVYDAEGAEEDVYVVERYAYVIATSYEGGEAFGRLEVVDVADPTSPARIGLYEFPREVSRIFVAGEIAYVVSNMCAPMPGGTRCFGVVRLVDVTTPEVPRLLSVYRPPGSARSVFVTGAYAYVADGSAGLRIVDVSDPTRPREVGGTAPMPAATVHVSGDYAYVGVDWRGTARYSGVYVFDVSNRGAPVEVGFYLMRGVPFGIDVTGGYAYAAADWAGLMILRLTPPRLWRMFLPLLSVAGFQPSQDLPTRSPHSSWASRSRNSAKQFQMRPAATRYRSFTTRPLLVR